LRKNSENANDGIDDSITYGIYKKHLNDFREFITQIRNYLKNKPFPSPNSLKSSLNLSISNLSADFWHAKNFNFRNIKL